MAKSVKPTNGDVINKRKNIEVPTTEEIQTDGWEKQKKHAKQDAEADASKETPATGGDIVYLNRMIEKMNEDSDGLANAILEIHTAIGMLQEKIDKHDGMLKFTYAICQNPGIKEIADANRDRIAKTGFSFVPKTRK